VLPRLKNYIIARKQIKNIVDLQKLVNNPIALESKKKALLAEKNKPQSINYAFYLPSGNGKYLEFIRYFLLHIYKNVPNQSMQSPSKNNRDL
jgi:hypothetical protein